jgi:hypothetical protein
MPIMNVHGQSNWLPTNEQLESEGLILTPEFQLVHNLLTQLPEWAAKCINEYDEHQAVKPEQVMVVPHVFHAWGQNLPGIWLDLQPDDVDDTAQNREARRWSISAKLKERVKTFLRDNSAVKAPSLDIECRPLSGSGISLDNAGFKINHWGKPHWIDI